MRFNNFSMFNPAIRQKIARFFLLMGAVGPGIALLINPLRWGVSSIFAQLSHLSGPIFSPDHFLRILGASLVIASILVLIAKFRDIGYVWIAIFYLITNFSAVIAICEGKTVSALAFALPVLLWVYLEAVITASRDEEHVPTQYTELSREG